MPEAVDLSHAFGLSPEKAVKYFQDKGYAFSWDWHEIYQDAHNKAFTVAKVTRMDVLEDIRGMVDKSLTEGITLNQFRKELEPKLKAKGWWGRQTVEGPNGLQEVQLGNPWRLRTIYRTNLQTAYAAGRWKEMVANADDRPYLQFICVLDAHTRPTHRIMHGKVFRIDDPIWKKMAPPLGWGCRCRLIALDDDDLKRLGLKVESSEGTLSTEDKLVSETTGEMKPVTVYTDPKTGKRVITDPGFDYNPGIDSFEPDLPHYDKDIVSEYEKAVQKEGLASRVPIKNNGDIGKLLAKFDEENPGIFQKGFSEAKVTSASKYLMAATQDGQIMISSVTSVSGMNPARDLKSALRNIAAGNALSFNEEYSLEALWHEIGHCRSKGWIPQQGRPTFITQIMETLNQWVARQTYPEFMETLGGKPAHEKEILENGYGYRTYINNFRTLLRLTGADETTALGLLRPLSVDAKWYDLPALIPEKLAGLLQKPELQTRIQKALRLIDIRDATVFENAVKKILEGA